MSASIHPVRNLISNGASLHPLIPLLTYLAVQPPSDSKWKWKWGQPPLFSTWRFRRQVSYGSLTAHCPTPSVQHRVLDTLRSAAALRRVVTCIKMWYTDQHDYYHYLTEACS